MSDPVASNRLNGSTVLHSTALAGIVFLILSVACFAILDTTAKRVTAEVPLFMAIWARYFFQALATSACVLPIKGLSVFRTVHPRMQVLRGALLMVVTALAFLSLKFFAVGEFTAIVMTTPLLVTLLAAHFLGEHVSIFRVLLVGGGFIGTLVIVRPGSEGFGWPMLLPLALVMVNTAFQLMTSKMSRTEEPMTTQFYTSWVGTLIASVPLIGAWVDIGNFSMWMGLGLMGIAGSAGHFLLIKAFGSAPAATLMPYMYVQIGFAMVGGWLVFDHVPDTLSLVGITLIAACGIAGAVLTVQESRLRGG